MIWRWTKRLLLFVWSLIALVLWIVVGAIAFLQTNRGAELVRSRLVPLVNEKISGKLAVAQIDFAGRWIILRDVVLRDPEGDVVASVDEIAVKLAPSALLKKTGELDAVRIRRPDVTIVKDESGTNLQRALQPRSPKPKEPAQSQGGSSFSVVVKDAQILDGHVVYEQTTGQKPLTVALGELDAHGAVSLLRGGASLTAQLGASTTMLDPTQLPITLQLGASGESDHRVAELELHAGDAIVSATLDQAGSQDLAVDLKQAYIPPDLVKAFAPTYPLRVAVNASGKVKKVGQMVGASAAIDAGSAQLSASGDLNLDTWRTHGLQLDASHVDLSQLVEKGPKSDLALSVRAQGGGKSLETMDGALKITAPESTIDGDTFGPILVDAEADQGHVTLNELTAKLPGAELTAKGQGDRQNLHLSGQLTANDLSEFGKTLGKLKGPQGLPVSGSGALAFDVEGPTRSPSVSIAGGFPSLRYAENSVQGLHIRGSIPSVRQPLEGDLHFELSAQHVEAAGKELVSPKVLVATRDRNLRLEASTKGFATLSLNALGKVDPDRHGVWLNALALSYPEACWSLEHPAHVRITSDLQSVTGLSLRAGKQRLAVDLKKSGEVLHANVDVESLRLDKLPKAFVDPSLKLGGTVSLQAKADGPLKSPDVSAKLKVSDAQVKQYQHLNFALNADYAKDRARGDVSAQALGIDAKGDFDIPVKALKTGGSEKVSANLEVKQVALECVLAALDKQVPLKGALGGSVHLSGTASNPKLDATIDARRIVYENEPPIDATLTAKTDAGGKLGMKAQAEVLGKQSFVSLELPWTLGRMLRRPPTSEQILHSRMVVDGKIDDFPIPLRLGPQSLQSLIAAESGQPATGANAGVGGAGPAKRAMPGFAFLGGDIRLRGTPLAPRGDLDLSLRHIQGGDGAPLRAAVKLNLQPQRVTLSMRVNRRNRDLLSANGTLNARLSSLRSPRALARARFELDASFGPMSLMELQQLQPAKVPTPGETPRPVLSGVLLGTLKASGSLNDPRFDLDASVHGLGTAQNAAEGDVSVRMLYADARATLGADMLSSPKGQMAIRANSPIDLSYRALKKGIAWRTAPIDASLRAAGFDPAFLSGISPMVQKIGGTIEASLNLKGNASLPHVRGQLEWKDGLAVLQSYGEYKQIHVLVSGNEERVELKDATAHSGRGVATLTGTFTREGEKVAFDSKAKLDAFPIVNQDQFKATITMNATAKGSASMELIDIPELRIPEAHIELPAKGGRDLQQLQPPEGIAFMVNGKLLEKPVQPSEKEASAQTAVGGAGPAGTEGTTGRELRVHVIAPRNLWVKGKEINVEIGLGDDFRVRMDRRPLIFGDVLVKRGRLEVLGRRFDLSNESVVTFTGPPLSPRLNVIATYNNSREDVLVTLRITGPADDLKIQPTSQPPLPESEIYTLIVTGRRSFAPGTASTGGGGGAIQGAATSFIGGLIASQLKKSIQSVLPIDVLSIQPGQRGVQGTRVEAGTYINDRLYLGVQSTLGAQPNQGENQNQLRVEYQLWKRWMLQLEYGDAQKGTGELLWKKSY